MCTSTRSSRPAGVPLLGLALCLSVVVPAAKAEGTPQSRRTPVVDVVAAVQDAVVSISTDERVRVQVGSEPFDSYYGRFQRPRYAEQFRESALGSGVIVDKRGYVVTNYHVVRRGARIRVHLRSGKSYLAEVMGTDPESDLAVLRLKAERAGPLPALPFANSDDMMLGETVLAIGNPFGLSHTVSTGIISAMGRSLGEKDRLLFDLVQTDASINPGNSGGPLINLDGEVVGINTAIFGEGQNLGFAIPARRVTRVVSDLIKRGEVREPWLGLELQDNNTRGLLVAGLRRGSPVRGKVRKGDRLTSLDSRPIDSAAAYRYWLRGKRPGETLQLGLEHEARAYSVSVMLPATPAYDPETQLWEKLGVKLGEANGRSGLPVVRVRPGSLAMKVGLRNGDRVRGLNAMRVSSHTQLRAALQRASSTREILLIVQRGSALYELSFRP